MQGEEKSDIDSDEEERQIITMKKPPSGKKSAVSSKSNKSGKSSKSNRR